MTAIFAMVRGDALFVAGDTRRGSLLSICVQKVHSWGDEVLLGQSGNGTQQSKLIADLELGRRLATQRSESDLFALYAGRRSKHLAGIKPPARPNGTLTVAGIDPATGAGSLHQYDFATGARSRLPLEMVASGTNVAALTAIADEQLRLMRAGGGALPLDAWAKACVEAAVTAFPDDVDWPCDMLISRSSSEGGRILCSRRIDAASAVGLPEFAI